jgi:hypothetical protein
VHRGDRTIEHSMEKILHQEGVEIVCRQAYKGKELFEFWK